MRLIRNWYKLLEGSGLVANDSGPAAAQGTLTANVAWLPFYSPPFSTIALSGSLFPDATGYFFLAGIYNSQPYFKNTAKGYNLWYDPAAGFWYISILLGTVGTAYWEGTDIIDPAFQPQGTATGEGSTTCPYTLPYDQKGVTIGSSLSKISSPAAGGFPAAAGSIELLVRPTWNNADSLRHNFWQTSGGAARVFQLFKHTDNTLVLHTDSTSRGSFVYPFVAHTLYHIVLNWGTNELFINNALVKNYTDGTLGLGSSTIHIGDTAATANTAFTGHIYYFISRDVALTLAEIAAFRQFFTNLYIPQPP